MLAGLIQSPETLNPITHPDRAARRRATVLDAMIDTKVITAEQARLAREEPLPTKAVSPDRVRDSFTQSIVDQLVDDKAAPGSPATYIGVDGTSRFNALFRGGLKVYTSYDPVMQWLAASAVQQVLPANRDPRFVAAVAVIDNATGEVRAMYTGKDFSQEEFNPVTQTGRQTGSSFKGITLAAALEAGYSPNDLVSGGSFTIKRPQAEDKRLACKGGTMTLADATAESNNCAYTRTLMSLGPGHFGDDGAQRVIDMAGRLGIDSTKLSAVPSLTLGTSDTNVLDMAEAYSVFANEGVHRTPSFITKIVGPDGKIIYQADTSGTRVISEQNARTETQILTGVITDGTGTRAKLDRPAAGKTGTTTDYTDAWFVGYTPQYTTAVWMGSFEGTSGPNQMRNVGGIAVTGGSYPARIWAAFMAGASKDLPVIQFTPPDETQWPAAQKIDEFGRAAGKPLAPRVAAHRPEHRHDRTDGRRPHRRRAPGHRSADRARHDTDRTGPADPVSAEELERLLVVQEHDLALDRLRHRRATLPERAELEANARALAHARRAARRARRAAGHRARRREAARRRSPGARRPRGRSRPEAVLRHGHARPASCRPCRPTSTCSSAIAVRSRGPRARGDGAAGDARRRDHQPRRRAEALAGRRDAPAGGDRRAGGRDRRRAATEDCGARARPRPGSPTRCCATTSAAASRTAGAGAARLVGTTCQACHLTIPSTEAERIRRADGNEVAYCDNCGAILVP